MSDLRLREPETLADVIDGSDVRMILCGHNHHEELGALGSVPVWVSPSVAYRMDVLSREEFHKVPGSAFSQLIVVDDELTLSIIPIPISSSRS